MKSGVPGIRMDLQDVTPCVGVWIEILSREELAAIAKESLPAWECGLKYEKAVKMRKMTDVTPCVGVWIEMGQALYHPSTPQSLPAWECGLKSLLCTYRYNCLQVTPCVGVWIEIGTGSVPPLYTPTSLPAWECGLK